MTEIDAILEDLKGLGVEKLVWDGAFMTIHYGGREIRCEVEAVNASDPEADWTAAEVIAASTSVASFCLRVFKNEVPWPESWGPDPREGT